MAKKVAGAGAVITDEGTDAEPETPPNPDPQFLTTDPARQPPAIQAQPDAPQLQLDPNAPPLKPAPPEPPAPTEAVADSGEKVGIDLDVMERSLADRTPLDAARTVEAMARTAEQAGNFGTSHQLYGVAGALAVLKGKLLACDYHFEGDLGLMMQALRDEL